MGGSSGPDRTRPGVGRGLRQHFRWRALHFRVPRTCSSYRLLALPAVVGALLKLQPCGAWGRWAVCRHGPAGRYEPPGVSAGDTWLASHLGSLGLNFQPPASLLWSKQTWSVYFYTKRRADSVRQTFANKPNITVLNLKRNYEIKIKKT